MSIEKAELKILITQDIGCEVEDQKERVERDKYRSQGSASALLGAAQNITKQIHPVVKKDFEEGIIPESCSGLDLVALINRYVTKASNLCTHLSGIAENRALLAEGGQKQLEQILIMLKKRNDAEEAKKAAVEATLQEASAKDGPENGGGRPVGVRPDSSLKARRTEEKDTEAPEPVEKPKPKTTRKTVKKKARAKGA